MAKQYLKDGKGRILGWIEDSVNGKMYIRDWLGHICGWYKTASNTTYDKFGRLVGRGNLLISLLTPRS